jgi:large subunit ribosomal protein L28
LSSESCRKPQADFAEERIEGRPGAAQAESLSVDMVSVSIQSFDSQNPGALMAKSCKICGKSPVVGRQKSHAHNVSARRFEPNLQTVRALINGGIKRIRVCTRCLRSNKVVKAA